MDRNPSLLTRRHVSVAAALCLFGAGRAHAQSMTETLSSALSINKKIMDAVDGILDFIDGTNKGMEQFEAAKTGGMPPPLDDSPVTSAVIEPRIAAIERLADGLPKPQALALDAFDAAAIGKLAPIERRARLRESVSACSAAATQLDSGRSLLAQYRELGKSIEHTADLVRALGVRLEPLLGLATAPVPKSDFLASVGWLPLALERTYPERLMAKVNALYDRRRAAEATLAANLDALKMRIAGIDPALAAEVADLKGRHERFLALQRELDRLARLVDELQEQTIAAINARDASERALTSARQFLEAAARAEAQAMQRRTQTETSRSNAFEATKRAFSWCPNKESWDRCNHAQWKSEWIEKSLDSTASAHRNARAEAQEASRAVAPAMEAHQQAQRDVDDWARKLRADQQVVIDYRNAAVEEGRRHVAAQRTLEEEKYSSRIDLLWSANESDRKTLKRVSERL